MPQYQLEKSNDINRNDVDGNKIMFDGKEIPDWEVLEFKSVTNKKSKSDLIKLLNGTPVFTKNSQLRLNPYIEKYVQYLPIKHDLDLVLVNVINVIECVDYKRTIIRSNPWNTFSGFEKLYFLEEFVRDEYIFKLKENPHNFVYVTDAFIEIVLNAKLKGFEFIEVWDSECTPEIELNKQNAFEQKVNENNQSDTKLSWDQGYSVIENGGAIASGAWKLQRDKHGVIMLGQLTLDLKYVWIDPAFFPPVLFSLDWIEIDKSDI